MSNGVRRPYVLRWAAALVCLYLLISPARADPSADAAALAKASADFAQGDFENAWFRYWTLARRGDPNAEFNLAQLYRFGKGIPVDRDLARYWYAKAAAQNHGYAQYNLGVIYEVGDGTPRDLAQAREWYRRAAAQNVSAAEAALKRLDAQARERATAPKPPPPSIGGTPSPP